MSTTNISGMRIDFMLHEYYIDINIYVSTCDVHPFDLATICHPPLPLQVHDGRIVAKRPSKLVAFNVPR